MNTHTHTHTHMDTQTYISMQMCKHHNSRYMATKADASKKVANWICMLLD